MAVTPVLYLINNTDDSMQIVITPRQFDGALGVSRNTDLTLYGNAAPNWGERFNENFVRLLENFAVTESNPSDQDSGDPFGDDVPTPKTEINLGLAAGSGFGINNPITGQLWYNKSRNLLHVYSEEYGWNPASSVLVAEEAGEGTGFRDTIIPNPREGELVFVRDSGQLQVFDGSSWIAAAGDSGDFVLRAGDTMTGALLLHAHPTGGSPALQAATKQYVLDQAGETDHGQLTGLADDDHTQYVHRTIARSPLSAHITMDSSHRVYISGNLTPQQPNELATKQYIDDVAGSAGVVVLATGTASHGTVVPYPLGYDEDTCTMIVSMREAGELLGAAAIDFLQCWSTPGGIGFTITARYSKVSNPNFVNATANYWILANGGSIIPPNPGGVSLEDELAITSQAGNNPYVGIRYKTDGTCRKYRGSSTISEIEFASATNNWLVSGLATDYQVYVTQLSGDAVSSGSLNTWLSLGSVNRNWRVVGAPFEIYGATILVTMREASSGIVIDSCIVELTEEGLS